MAENIWVQGQESYFNEDAKFFKDVYVYGTLYYDFDGLGDNLRVDDLVVNGQASLKNLYVTGLSTFTGNVSFTEQVTFSNNIFSTGISTFQKDVKINGTLDVENIDVGIATVRERFELTNDGGTNYLTGFVTGARAGRVGIGSTLPDQKLDIDGSLRITENIYDSINYPGGNSGYYLSRDANGLRWVFVPPEALSEGMFIQNEGVQVGVGSFTTINFIGNNSGGDLVNATVNSGDNRIVDVSITDHWLKGPAGLTTSVNVGINVNSPQNVLDVGGIALFRDELRVSGIATFSSTVGINAELRVHDNNIIGTATTAIYAHLAGVSTYARVAGVSTFAIISGISTFANQSGFATVSGFSTNAARAGISTFIETTETGTDQQYYLPFVENSTTTSSETVRVDAGIKFNPSRDQLNVDGGMIVGGATTINNRLTVQNETLFLSSIELDGTLVDINGSVATGKTDYRLASVGTGVSWRPAGVETKNILYVTKDGDDNNSGLLEGDAKATIGGAAAVAQDGDTIYVRPGTYFENNPIGLRTDVSVSGQDLRLVTVVPNNPTQDLFHVRRGCLLENMNFAGNNVSIAHTGAAMVAFPPTGAASQNSGYVAAGPANEGPSGRWRSPYVRNCTNFATSSIGMRVNGDHVNAAFSGTNNLGQDLKTMVVDSYTQYNQNGIGVSITNKAYAQLVSIFTINCHTAIFAGTGGQCDLTNSNSSFGVYGLYADGTSGDEFTGITTGTVAAEEDTYTIYSMRDDLANVRKPFDGQGAFFKINLDDYTDTGTKTGIITEPLRTIRSIKITNGGSGYTAAAPPNITVSTPFGPEGILAELSANVSAAGTISSVDIISSGRNFLPAGSGSNQQDITVNISGSGGATAEAVTDPILYTVDTATEPTPSTGITTVTFNEFVPYTVGTGVSISMRRLSRIITSSHSFEYVGAGTDINRANPFQGGVPIPENEVVAINGGQIPFTSTDQKGNFRIGQGLTIDQTTATISGRDFNRAIQANLTPLILALGG
jgi:hypothetical protein